MDDESGEFVST